MCIRDRNCPSRALTLSPRQRIVGLREMARLRGTGEDASRLQALSESYEYQGIETCAADSLCSLTCPVGINTGTMMLKQRGQQRGTVAQWAGSLMAKQFAGVTAATRFSLTAANLSHRIFGTWLQGGVTLSLIHI